MDPEIDQSSAPVVAQGLFSYQIGGSERVGADVARAVAERGFRSLCFAFYDSDGPVRDELEASGVECFDLNFERRKRLSRRLTYQWMMYRWLRANRVQALHVHHATALMLAGLPAKAAGVQRVVMTEHALHQLRERPWYRREARMYCPLADAVTVVHPTLADYFVETMRVPRDRVHYVPNGVKITGRDSVIRRRVRQGFGVDDKQRILLFAGRLHEVKDLPTLLHAFAAAARSRKETPVLWLAGEGPERSGLESLAIDVGIRDRIFFLGARSDVRDLMSAADVFVMSSYTEGLPMVLLEAMATGLPCIATAVGGIPELLGDCGVIVPPRDPGALAQAMLAVLDDPVRLHELSASAANKVGRENDLEHVVDQYLNLLGLPGRWPVRAARTSSGELAHGQ